MEEQLKKLKSGLKDELDGFEFDAGMKRNVSRRFAESGKPRGYLFRRMIPAGLSLAFLAVFSLGMYWVIEKYYTENHANTPPAKEESPVAETPDDDKPELIVPPYVPDGYAFKHTHTDGDVYEHMYMNEQNEAEYFAYIMREEKPDYPVPDIAVDLADGLVGKINKISDEHLFLTWQDEGMYQIVERKGSLTVGEFNKIADAILKAKGYEPTFDLLRLNMEPVVAFDEKTAVEMLTRYDYIWKSVYQEADTRPGGKFPDLKTKEEFYQLFLDFISYELVEKTFKFRLGEKEDGIYIIPIDPVPSFWPETKYNLAHISEDEYQLTQIQETKNKAPETLVVTYKKTEGIWKIESITTKTD
ncbi:DUF4367 domain-containing protein [Mesobacillus sp. S13]|uniref:DUF4367 domain-containing protein n=1 Tax=Mesobacillus sp. S13 TaxID=2880221 RepID=UPI001CF3BB5D|nr:DUF4367 domain-containing protein [Mesobacillus sp. S13]